MSNESTAPDLTAAAAAHAAPYGASEARAEIASFMGDGWTVMFTGPTSDEPQAWATAYRKSRDDDEATTFDVTVSTFAPTNREAVAALKQSWRDAVRPWMRAGWAVGYSAGCAGTSHEQIEHDTKSVLGEEA